MSPFGPFYPPRLQMAVNHADRLLGLLEREDRGASSPASRAEAWVVGRSGELARVVEAVAQDWRRGARTADAAAVALEEHLASLHDGLASRFGFGELPCCRRARQSEAPGALLPATTSLDSVERLLGSLECLE